MKHLIEILGNDPDFILTQGWTQKSVLLKASSGERFVPCNFVLLVNLGGTLSISPGTSPCTK